MPFESSAQESNNSVKFDQNQHILFPGAQAQGGTLTTYQMFLRKNGTPITGLTAEPLDGSKGSFREIGNGYYTFEVVPATTSTTRVSSLSVSLKTNLG